MPSSIRVGTGFQTHRDMTRSAMDRVLPHRKSYLGFTLGLLATVIVALAGLGWWAVQSGVLYIQINL